MLFNDHTCAGQDQGRPNLNCKLIPGLAALGLALAASSAAASTLTEEAMYEMGLYTPLPTVAGGSVREQWTGVETGDPDWIPADTGSPRATFTVGPGGGCDFPNLNAALTSGNLGDGDVVNIADGGGYTGESYTILNRPGTLTLRGGFSDCSQPVPDSGRTTLNVNGESRVFYIEVGASYAGDPMQINLENLNVNNGNSSGSFGGGGILINGRPGMLSVNLRNVWVQNNFSSASGGGVKVRVNGQREGSGTLLTMDNDSVIAANATTGDGGGLSCQSIAGSDSSTLIRLGHGLIATNEAENGGAISVESCGAIFVYAGYSLTGIIGNEALDAGGAFYVRGDGAHLGVRGDAFQGFGETDNGALISGNSANRGGVLYARDESTVFLLDANLVNNSADGNGGAIYANAGPAEVHMRRINATEPCNEPGTLQTSRCSVVRGNSAGSTGGAFLARNDASIFVSRTRVENNTADSAGSVATVSGAGPGTIRMESVLATGNGGGAAEGLAAFHGVIDFRWSTMTDNEFTNYAMRSHAASASQPARINAYSSVMREDTGTMLWLGPESATAYADCLIGWQDEGDVDFTSTFGYRNVDPEFTNPADGDFRPGPTSPAIDFCDDVRTPEFNDLDGNIRGTAHQGPPLSPGGASFGPFDIGAYETNHQPDLGDEIFSDRFED